jgi:hypothetical protein
MTRHKHAQTGLVTPPLPQHWLTATLRVFAMLVHLVASTLQMICRREAVNVTQPTPTDLPQAKTDTQSQKANNAVQQDNPTTPSVSHALRAIHLPHTTCDGGKQRIVATKGNCLHQSKTGGGGSPRLRGETEGAVPRTPKYGSVNPVHAFPAKAGIQTSSEKNAQLVSPKHGEGGRAHHLDPRLRGGCVLSNLTRT